MGQIRHWLFGKVAKYCMRKVPVRGLGIGARNSYMLFDPGPWRCGSEVDGVAFGIDRLEGVWGISFNELEEMYRSARAVRGLVK